MRKLLIILSFISIACFGQQQFFIAQNTGISTPSPVVSITYAGTYPDGLILKTVDKGLHFTNEGSAGKGIPLKFCQLYNGDVVYTTTTGWIVNHTKSTSLKVSDYPIRAIYDEGEGGLIWIGDDNGDLRYSSNYGISFNGPENLGSKINFILSYGSVICTDNGIYWAYSDNIVQAGNFTFVIEVDNVGYFACRSDGHVFSSLTGETWTDLGARTYIPEKILNIIHWKIGVSTYKYITETRVLYTNPIFINFFPSPTIIANDISVIDPDVNYGFLLAGTDGHLYRYNESDQVVDLGQQFSQTSITCLISYQNK